MEAAVVCLEQQGHRSGISMEVSVSERVDSPGAAPDDRIESHSELFEVIWNPSSDQMRRSHADLPEATERGACGIAFLLALELTNYTIIERSFKNTGVDYGLGYREQLPWINSARLEISGTRAFAKSCCRWNGFRGVCPRTSSSWRGGGARRRKHVQRRSS
jgi:hypothetical protein